MKRGGLGVIIIVSLAALAVLSWKEILWNKPPAAPRIYFLDVGQGDAELLLLPGNIKILTDAGPNQKILQSMEGAIPGEDRYIDLGIISHPQLDHFNGFNYLLDNYKFGAFIFNGRGDSPGVNEWRALLDKIKSKNIPLITLSAGDKILHNGDEIDILSPGKELIQSAELNDTAIVELIKTGFRALLASDADFNVENFLLAERVGLRADILKVGHHGSKYSSGAVFLAAVNPKIAVIEVGAKNSYGHPTKEALARLASTTEKIFRTDENGTVEVIAADQKLRIFTGK